MIKNKTTFIYLLFVLCVFVQTTLLAQQVIDPKLPPVFNITSTFKPSILNNTKLPLVVAPFNLDTFKLNIAYSSLYQLNSINSLPYTLPTLSPLIYKNEVLVGEYANMLKIGYGNYIRYIPSVELILDNGNSHNKNIALSLFHQSIRGAFAQQYQDLSKLNFGYIVKTPKRFWNVLLNAQRNDIGTFDAFNLDTITLKPSNDFLSAGFYISSANQFSNTKTTPSIAFQYNQLQGFMQEVNAEIGFNAFHFFSNPYYYTHVFYAEINIKTNFDYAWKDVQEFKNLLASADAKFVYNKNFFNGQLGVKAFVSEKEFLIMPFAEIGIKIIKDAFNISGGLNTFVKNNNLANLFIRNTFLSTNNYALFNTYEQKLYININGSFNNKFYYLFQFGFNKISHQVLFKNNENDIKRFDVLQNEDVKKFEFISELKYQHSNFYIKLLIKNDSYIDYEINNLWGLPTLSVNTDIRINLFKNIVFTLGHNLLNPNSYLKITSINYNNPTMLKTPSLTNLYNNIDISIDYSISKQWRLWCKAYNVLNEKNDRWGNYKELPIHAAIGFQYHFMSKAIFAK